MGAQTKNEKSGSFIPYEKYIAMKFGMSVDGRNTRLSEERFLIHVS